jgi:hypothetical protein
LATLRLVTLDDQLRAGVELGAVHLGVDDTVTFTGQVAQEQFESIARRARRSPAEMFRLLEEHGWSNSKVAFISD